MSGLDLAATPWTLLSSHAGILGLGKHVWELIPPHFLGFYPGRRKLFWQESICAPPPRFWPEGRHFKGDGGVGVYFEAPPWQDLDMPSPLFHTSPPLEGYFHMACGVRRFFSTLF